MANTYIQIVQIVGAEITGNVQGFNVGKNDNGTPIYYELETQELEFINRAHTKKISDKIVILTENGIDGTFKAKQNDGDFKPIPIKLNNLINIGQDINLEGNFFTLKWYGEASETSPILNGIYLESITDQGIHE